MSFYEKQAYSELLSTFLSFGGYALYTYYQFLDSDPAVLHDVVYWARVFLWMLPVGIVAGILISILTAIIHQIAHREKPEAIFEDERDRLIELRSQRVAGWIFIAGVFISAGVIVADFPVAALFIGIASFGFCGAVVSTILKLIYYRRGI